MASATLTRLESLLAARRLDSTIARKDADAGATLVTTGITSLDTSLGGGWRRGEISEVLGPASSGRASVLCATLAAATARGELVALVDTFDRVDPVTAAATGLDLSRVLWVRGPSLTPTAAISRRDSLVNGAVLRAVRACDLDHSRRRLRRGRARSRRRARARIARSGRLHLDASRSCECGATDRVSSGGGAAHGPKRARRVRALDVGAPLERQQPAEPTVRGLRNSGGSAAGATARRARVQLVAARSCLVPRHKSSFFMCCPRLRCSVICCLSR